ncbi:MAG: FAD:protein FMN transferase [Candidatus Omnitrophota bacterium]
MGTFVEVISPDQRAAQIVFNEIKRIDNLLSKYKPDSEISQLNSLGKLRVSDDTMYVLGKAKEFYLASDGEFDITVGPLLDLWGFSEHKYYLPTAEEIKNAKSRVGFNKIILNEGDNMIEFSIPGMKVDLGGIAKGFAVDCAVKKLKEAGIKSCLINAGGQIHCLGDKFGKAWQIAIRNPRTEGLFETLQLKDKAVSTSGDYQQFFIKNKKRYSHILSPKTGGPVNNGIASVTVVASDGLTADALSTTIFAIGIKRWEALSKKYPDVRVKIIEDQFAQ